MIAVRCQLSVCSFFVPNISNFRNEFLHPFRGGFSFFEDATAFLPLPFLCWSFRPIFRSMYFYFSGCAIFVLFSHFIPAKSLLIIQAYIREFFLPDFFLRLITLIVSIIFSPTCNALSKLSGKRKSKRIFPLHRIFWCY